MITVSGHPVQLGLWIAKSATIVELGAQICSILRDGTVGIDNKPLKPSQLSFSSADMDGLRIRRHLMDKWSVGDIDLRYPLWAVETLVVHRKSQLRKTSYDDRISSRHADGSGGTQRRKSRGGTACSATESFGEDTVSHLLKIVQRTKVRGQNILVGNTSLLKVNVNASSYDVARAVCLICIRSCPDYFGDGEDMMDAVDRKADQRSDLSSKDDTWVNKMLSTARFDIFHALV